MESPGAVFAPVWTCSMCSCRGRVARVAPVWLRGARAALSLFIVQLALNAFWSYLFFGRIARPGLLGDLDTLAALLLTLLLFWRQVRLAGVLLLPYLAWVTFASFLNFALWQMNRGHLIERLDLGPFAR